MQYACRLIHKFSKINVEIIETFSIQIPSLEKPALTQCKKFIWISLYCIPFNIAEWKHVFYLSANAFCKRILRKYKDDSHTHYFLLSFIKAKRGSSVGWIWWTKLLSPIFFLFSVHHIVTLYYPHFTTSYLIL